MKRARRKPAGRQILFLPTAIILMVVLSLQDFSWTHTLPWQQKEYALQKGAHMVHQWLRSGENALYIECEGEHPACTQQQPDHAFALQFILPVIQDDLSAEDRAQAAALIGAARNAQGYYAHSPSFAADSDVSAGAMIALRALGQEPDTSLFEAFNCAAQDSGVVLYGTFLQDDIACDGQGFGHERLGRDRHRNFEPSVNASTLRVTGDVIGAQRRAAIIKNMQPYWRDSLYYSAAISAYFWLEALPADFAKERAEICAGIDAMRLPALSPLERTITAYNLYAHCGHNTEDERISAVLADVKDGVMFGPSLFWRYDGSAPERRLVISGHDRGVVAHAFALRLAAKAWGKK